MDKALEVLKEIRLACETDVKLDEGTIEFLKKMIMSADFSDLSKCREDLVKILLSPYPSIGIELVSEVGLLKYILPELEQCKQMEADGHKDVYEHSLSTLSKVSKMSDSLITRLAALLHDVGKVNKKRMKYACNKCGMVRYRKLKECKCGGAFSEDGWCFHGHEEEGARIVSRFGEEMGLESEITKQAELLVFLHMRPISYSSEWTDRSIRRLVRNAGNVLDELLIIARCDADSASPKKIISCEKRIDSLKERIDKIA